MHIIRRIRNDFAHNVEGCAFSDSKVDNRVSELRKSFEHLISEVKVGEVSKMYAGGARGDFQFCSSWIIDYLHKSSDSLQPIAGAGDEWAYDKSKATARKKGT
jgi:hypothetical protein